MEDSKKRNPGSGRRRHQRRKPLLVRICRGSIQYVRQLPTRTFVIFGGVISVLIVACLLAVVLWPRRQTDSGTLSIVDVTPTVSMAPIPTPSPAPTATPTANPLDGSVIKTVGEYSDLLPAVQERLVALGYMDTPEGGYTTKYGPVTKTAVRLFQIKNYSDSRQWDGQLGPDTYALLMSDQAKAYYLGRGDGDERTKNITKLVNDISRLQNRLIALGYLSITMASGYYGESTAVAVQLFQKYHGLTADGRAGRETLTLLYSDEAMGAATGKQNDRSKMTPAPSAAPTPMG